MPVKTICAGSRQEVLIYLPRQRGGRCPVCRQTIVTRNGKVATHYAPDLDDAHDPRDFDRHIRGQWPDRDPGV